MMDQTPAPVVVILTLDSGEAITIDGEGALLGRAPTRGAEDAGMTEVRVADSTMSISKTHLALVRTGDSVAVVDRWSTNGSSVIRGGLQRPLTAGEPVQLANGDTIRFGDRRAAVAIR